MAPMKAKAKAKPKAKAKVKAKAKAKVKATAKEQQKSSLKRPAAALEIQKEEENAEEEVQVTNEVAEEVTMEDLEAALEEELTSGSTPAASETLPAEPPMDTLPETAANEFRPPPPKRGRSEVVIGDLTPEAHELLLKLSSTDELQRTAFACGYDVLKVSLGEVTKDMVREGFTWLKAIERELSRPEIKSETLAAMSKNFFRVMPLREDASEQVCIDSAEALGRRLRVVEMISDVEAASPQWRLLLNASGDAAAAGGDLSIQDSMPRLYKSLKCEILVEDRTSSAWKLVEEYLHNTQTTKPTSPKISLKNVFSVNRPSEAAKFARFAQNPNRMLLWHGARPLGWLSLLAQGPRIPPKEAPDLGYAFGKGLYFSDAACAALEMCAVADGEGSEAKSKSAFLLLAEVALGNSNKLTAPNSFAEKLPLGCQSVFGLGSMTSDRSLDRLLDGLRVPCGPLRKSDASTELPYNQYVVYNAAQVRTRYVVEVEILPA